MLNDPDDYTKARNHLAEICSAFGVATPEVGAEGIALQLIDEGRLVYDPAREAVEYKLAVPIEVKGSASISAVSFTDPTQADLEMIHKDIRVERRGDSVIIDLGDMDTMTGRIIARLGKINTGLVDRIKHRDTATLSEVFTVLGFFG